jgi:hypothetical protein
MVGGQKAITAETEALWMVEHAIIAVAAAQSKGSKAPQPRQYPKGILTVKAEADAKAARDRARAARFRARHQD